MLRTALPLSRRAALHSVRQPARVQLTVARFYADKAEHKPPVLPGSQSSTTSIPPAPGSVSPGQPTPVQAQQSPAPVAPSPSSSQPPNTPPPTGPIQTSTPPPRRTHRFRNFLLTLVILSGLGFAGGVWYSSVSDNFHDFFTEYVPFGEQAVLYFEEREFRKRFPGKKNESQHLSENAQETVTIPSKSGLSWRMADGGKSTGQSAKGPHMSAVDVHQAQQTPDATSSAERTAGVQKAKKDAATKEKSQPVKAAKTEAKKESPPKSSPAAKPAAAPTSSVSAPAPATAPSSTKKSPEVNEPSVYVPVARIDPLAVNNADEPLVQDLVKILNDIILVANADNATGKYSGAMNKAKSELSTLGQRIVTLKETERQAAEKKIKSSEVQFDDAAKELVKRLESEMKEQEDRWRQEFDQERSQLQRSFDDKLQQETERSKKVADERLQNQLLEQAVALKKEFAAGVREQVENERQGRLAKLADLSNTVDELHKLTVEWNQVVEANVQTQHLINAVEAVRANLETSDRPRPFVRDLAALSEIAGKNNLVDTALSSINPTAYSFGIPTGAQLIDRFRRVADEVRKASLLPENAGMASHATSYVLSKVMFKKEGRAEGTDVESILLRTENLLEEGNFDDAAREMNSLTGWAKTLSSDWLMEVRRVLEVRQALEVIATEARLQSLKVD